MLPVKAPRGVETIATVVSTKPVSGSRDDNFQRRAAEVVLPAIEA